MKEVKIILIVEDEAPLRQALADKLGREGFKVLEAVNGQEGLERALKEHPDLILLDIAMPIMDGTTMLKNLRKDKWGKRVSVIILTNYSAVEKVPEVLESGAHDYIVKSSRLEDIINLIKQKLDLI